MRTPSQRLRISLEKENLWLHILPELAKGRSYAYGIKKDLEKAGIKTGLITVYSVLYKLELGGFIKSDGMSEGEGGPKRKYYEITAKGKEELAKGKNIIKDILRII